MRLRATVRRTLVAAGVLACLATPGLAASATAGTAPDGARLAAVVPSPTTDWPAYERNAGHSSAIFGDQTVTPANAGALRRVWRFTAPGPTQTGQPVSSFDASPTVVGNRVYLVNRTGVLYALSTTTGAVAWSKQLGWGTGRICPGRGAISTATVAADPVDGTLTVYAAGANHLYALDATTGAQRWRHAVGPDTATGRDRYLNWTSPTVAGGRIFMGLASKCDSAHIRGGVASYNQHTGALQHTWYDMAAGHVGGSVWTSVASDGATVWATTGNPDPAGDAIDDAYSIVRLDAATLTKREKWTAPNAVDSDLDFGTSPTLYSGTVGGTSTLLVGACNKNGNFYTWRRSALAAGPVWTRKVGTTGLSGEGACLPSAAWDFQRGRIFVASNTTTIDGTTGLGGLRALNPGTGAVLWDRSLPCRPNGSPTVNGTVVAVPLYDCGSASPGVALLAEADGRSLGRISTGGPVFAQPVFASGRLFVAAEDGTLVAYAP